jgi:hypothetical protein
MGLFVGVVAVACGADTSGGRGAGGTTSGGTDAGGTAGAAGTAPLSIQEFAHQYAVASCEKISTCCSTTEADSIAVQCGGFDDSSCPSVLDTCWLGAMTASLLEGAERGRLVLDEEAARACVEALRGKSCREYTDEDDASRHQLPCPSIVEPRVALGQPCNWSFECISGSCESEATGVPGKCRPMPGPGEPCPLLNCPAGYFCPFDTQVCSPVLANDAECSEDAECASNHCSVLLGGRCAKFAPGWCDGVED